MKYTQQWFNGARHNFEKFVLPMAGLPKLKFLEIGTFEGMAAVWMLQNVLTHKDSYLVVVDPFAYLGIGNKLINFTEVKNNFMENTQAYKDKIVLHQSTSEEMWPYLVYGQDRYDFIYVDGSHKACDVMLDAVNAWLVLKPGGILLFDDYTWGAGNEEHMRPRPAIDAFLTSYKDRYELLEKGNQVAVKKIN